MNKLLAEIPIHPGPDTPLQGAGTLGNPGSGENAVAYFFSFISGLIGLLTIIAGLYFMFTIITGAISIVGGGGDPKKIETARSKITTGIIGMIVVVSAIFIVDFIGDFLGYDILNPIDYWRTILPTVSI